MRDDGGENARDGFFWHVTTGHLVLAADPERTATVFDVVQGDGVAMQVGGRCLDRVEVVPAVVNVDEAGFGAVVPFTVEFDVFVFSGRVDSHGDVRD